MKFKYITVFLVLISAIAFSQESNYWFHNFGAISSLKGGIETGGVNNATALYYNPGALALIDGKSFDGQADVLSMDIINIDNAGGDGIDLNLVLIDVAPSIVVYSKRFNKNDNFSYSIGALTRFNSSYAFDIQHQELGNYLLPNDEKDVFQGHYQYSNKIREGWLMGAIAYRVNENIGIGISTNIFVRSQDYFNSYNASAIHLSEINSNEPFSKLASTYDEQKLTYRVMGLSFKPGINFKLEPLKLGLTITTPAISLGLLNNSANRTQISNLPDEKVSYIHEADAHTFYSGVYKTPLSVNIGAEYQFDRVSISVSSEWFSKVDPYNVIKIKEGSEDQLFPTTDDPNYAIPMMANKSVVNFGVGLVYNIKESLTYVGSFRTDFNFFDDKALNRNEDFVPNGSYWDIYHITSGIVFSLEKTRITLGVNYGFGNSENDAQYINMTTASQSNSLRGDINNSTSAQYNNLSFTVGLNLDLTNDKNKNDQ